jgi:mono/diheme cytochrome c family protein
MKMTLPTIVVGGLVVFIAVLAVAVFLPALVWNPPQTTIAHPYTPEQERGRVLFYSNGCNYCHTQYVRAEDTGMGPVSQGGDYVFDNPVILGSERTGPDLSYVGRKRSEAWEIEHLQDPRRLSPLSIMPSFEFLSEEELSAIAAYLFALGDRVAQERMILPPESYAGLVDPTTYPTVTVSPDDQGWATWESAGLQQGKETYVDYCLTCHGCSGNGLGSYAGTMVVTPADFKQEPFRSMPDDQWFWHVSEGVQGTLMPTWKASLSEDEIWQVIRYVQQTFARPVMRDPAEGDPPDEYAGLTSPVSLTVSTLDDGKRIFIRECMVCHGDAGRGGGPYAEGLQPSPPDFGDGSYGTLQDPSFADSDYFWRISEGLPWSAMPAWKLQYSEEDRWRLVEYIRVTFTQTEERPTMNELQVSYPDIYLSQVMPEGASFEEGKRVYLTTCAHCHGLDGLGSGVDGQYLDVPPANLTDPNVRAMSEGELFTRVTFGVPNSAMPTWGEFLAESARWNVIKYLGDAFILGRQSTSVSYTHDEVAANFVTLSRDNWIGEGHVISTTHGSDLYGSSCAVCHGQNGVGSPPKGPALYPADMGEAYILWRIWEGVPGSTMYPFQWVLSEADMWDITDYVESLASQEGGGR